MKINQSIQITQDLHSSMLLWHPYRNFHCLLRIGYNTHLTFKIFESLIFLARKRVCGSFPLFPIFFGQLGRKEFSFSTDKGLLTRWRDHNVVRQASWWEEVNFALFYDDSDKFIIPWDWVVLLIMTFCQSISLLPWIFFKYFLS